MWIMKHKLISIVAGVGIAAVPAVYYLTRPALAQFAVSLDTSGSVERGCVGLAGAAKTLIEQDGIRAGSTLSMLVIGNDRQNPDARMVFRGPVPVASGRVIGDDKEAHAQAQDELLGEVERACNAAKTSRASPVYQLVKQTIDVLRSQGTDPKGRGFALIKTDLDDDTTTGLREAIARSVRTTNVTVPADLVCSIDNAGIEIKFCGVAEVQPRRRIASTSDARILIWKQLFTHSELVSFEGYCGAASQSIQDARR